MKTTTVQRRYLPSHAVLRSFECAARHQSFTLAAEELHLTQSAISRQVRELEELVGLSLFRRTGRHVELTPAGLNLAHDLAIDLENIHQTIMRAVSAGDEGTSLRIAALPGFAANWLIPRLPDFSSKHPTIKLNIASRLEPFDMEREHFDLAIHFGVNDWPDTRMIKLCNETMIPVSSKEFKERHKISSLRSLTLSPLLHMETRPMVWSQFFSENGLDVVNQPPKSMVSISKGMYFDQFSLIIAAATASLGAAIVPTYLVGRQLAAGDLVRIGKAKLETDNSYFLVTPKDLVRDDVEVFCDWIMSAMKKIPL